MSNDQYKEMCLEILHNETWYKKITSTTVTRFYEAFYTLVDDALSLGAINRDFCEFSVSNTTWVSWGAWCE